jgi:hypothetical protein
VTFRSPTSGLRGFSEVIPLTDAYGKPTLWDTVIYDRNEMRSLNEALKEVYALIKVDGDKSVVEHLYADRVDFCTFGNSTPFRIRIVNAYNDNQDYFYIKKADASRVYGLELEHLLSPNRLNFITHGSTLVEEHIPGIPGDIFINSWLHRPDLSPVRVAKELVKFNERCFVRLLGDMRSYNFVFVVTPDFEDVQLRVRAMDFDQQSYNGRKNFYRPQFFKENAPLALFCSRHLRIETANQYLREEQTLILQRAELAAGRLGHLLAEMEKDPISPPEKVGLAARIPRRALRQPGVPSVRVDGRPCAGEPGVHPAPRGKAGVLRARPKLKMRAEILKLLARDRRGRRPAPCHRVRQHSRAPAEAHAHRRVLSPDQARRRPWRLASSRPSTSCSRGRIPASGLAWEITSNNTDGPRADGAPRRGTGIRRAGGHRQPPPRSIRFGRARACCVSFLLRPLGNRGDPGRQVRGHRAGERVRAASVRPVAGLSGADLGLLELALLLGRASSSGANLSDENPSSSPPLWNGSGGFTSSWRRSPTVAVSPPLTILSRPRNTSRIV